MSKVQNAVRGTVKVGRWEYPAILNEDGSAARNTKRDGTGEWVDVDAAKFVGETGGVEVPEQRSGDDVPEIDGFTAEGHSDYDDLRVAYIHIFDSFATTYDELASHLGCDESRAKRIVSMLNDKGLTVTDLRKEDGTGSGTETVIQSYKTYDDHTKDEVLVDFAEAFQEGVKIRRSSGHGGKVGAQHKKPGKSTWQPGTPCPQGHKLGKDDVYVMPSGRKQCKQCRAGYPSNTASDSAV